MRQAQPKKKTQAPAATGTSNPKPASSGAGSVHSLIIPHLIQMVSCLLSRLPSRLDGVLGLDGAKYQFWLTFSKPAWIPVLKELEVKSPLADDGNSRVYIDIMGTHYQVLGRGERQKKNADPYSRNIYPYSITDLDHEVTYRFGHRDTAYHHQIPGKHHVGESPNIIAVISPKALMRDPDLRVHEQRIHSFVRSLAATIDSYQLERVDIAFDVLGLETPILCHLRHAQACAFTSRDGEDLAEGVAQYTGRHHTGFWSGKATSLRLNCYDKLHEIQKKRKRDPQYTQLLQTRWGQVPTEATRVEFQVGDAFWEAFEKHLPNQTRTATTFYANIPWAMRFLMEEYFVFYDAPFDPTYNGSLQVLWFWDQMSKGAQTWNGTVGRYQLTKPGSPPAAATAGSSSVAVMIQRSKKIKTLISYLTTFGKDHGFDLQDADALNLLLTATFIKMVIPDPHQIAEMAKLMKKDRKEFLEDLMRAMPGAFKPRPFAPTLRDGKLPRRSMYTLTDVLENAIPPRTPAGSKPRPKA